MKLKKSILLICSVIWGTAECRTHEFDNGMKFDISGYVGWKQIFSDRQFDSVPSEPDIGLTTSLKVTDRLNIFNQFRYGNSINEILVYNQINYTPAILMEDFELTIKGGKLWYDWGLYGKTRVNPRTRKGVFQPQSMYWNTLDTTITGGVGLGVDIKYKEFSISYIVDKTAVTDKNKTAGAWVTPFGTDYRSSFGGHQSVVVGYGIPEYGLRFVSHVHIFNTSYKILQHEYHAVPTIGGLGVEWEYENLTLSVEGLCTRKPKGSWAFSQLYCGISPSIEYDIDENWSVRMNYNQYSTPLLYSPVQTQNFSRDLNIGVGWHMGNWVANLQADYIRGGRLVDPANLLNNPYGYKEFYVVGMNLVYFWD